MPTIESLLNPCPSKLLFSSKSLLKPNSIDFSSSIFSPAPRLRKFCSSSSLLSIRCSVTQGNPWSDVPSESRESRTPRFKHGIHRFVGQTLVVKYGGAIMQSSSPSQSLLAQFAFDLLVLVSVGVRVIMVHAGGLQINDLLNTLHKKMVSMVDIDPTELPIKQELEFVTSEVARMDPAVLEEVLVKGNIPVVCSVAAEADTVAGEIAGAVGPERLIFMTDVAGILKDRDDPKRFVVEIDVAGVKKMVEEGKIGGGMISKVNCCVRALGQGVRAAMIIDGRKLNSLDRALSVEIGLGTLIVA